LEDSLTAEEYQELKEYFSWSQAFPLANLCREHGDLIAARENNSGATATNGEVGQMHADGENEDETRQRGAPVEVCFGVNGRPKSGIVTHPDRNQRLPCSRPSQAKQCRTAFPRQCSEQVRLRRSILQCRLVFTCDSVAHSDPFYSAR
jgi:hypothetical protein